ncbi:DUF397 domain-containing protein [Streptomyces sp. SID3343]|uniref:DUF397 domain-containing protein n=1 Tax=Streptomyces sp. SID3343 TaxID=2690260 RepID=UPI001370E152|nr:DUF397 domain-containing protein [Streptomyces sp. SID3343]
MTHQPTAERQDHDGARWFKARASQSGTGCVEIAHLADGHVGLRDTKSTRPPFVFDAHEWACFIDGAKNGEFDPPTR